MAFASDLTANRVVDIYNAVFRFVLSYWGGQMMLLKLFAPTS